MSERAAKPRSGFRTGQDARHIAYWLVGIAFVFLVLGYLSQLNVLNWIHSVDQFIDDFYANVTAELLSIGFTIIVIDALNERRSIKDRLDELGLQMGSPNGQFAVEAVRILRLKGWLSDGSLKGVNLERAILEDINLEDANLEGASLRAAKLRAAILDRANLKRADLSASSLQRAHLQDANLEGAALSETVLEGATLNRAQLQAADLSKANLKGASFDQADLKDVNLSEANLHRGLLLEANLQNVVLVDVNLLGASVTDEQLVMARSLLGATMSSGASYDGRFNLSGDIEFARGQGYDPNDPEVMAAFYAIPVESYLDGQRWAQEHLEALLARSREWHREAWSTT